jgi:hypothetical protein
MNSPLPERYASAKRALRLCARDFTPANYAAASIALQQLWADDPCEAIADDQARFAAYCKISNDGELERLALRISEKHRTWKDATA